VRSLCARRGVRSTDALPYRLATVPGGPNGYRNAHVGPPVAGITLRGSARYVLATHVPLWHVLAYVVWHSVL
jgi:hypothetical protein